MDNYTNEYRVDNFPNSVMPKTNFINVNDSIAALINEINSYRAQGRYDLATEIIRQNSTTLAKASIDATTVNMIVEELRNAQVYALKASQGVYVTTTEPATAAAGDVWVGQVT